MNKQQLANKIWESANEMRSKIEANEYKDYILGFIFYKFLSDKEVKYLKGIGYTDDTIKQVTEEENKLVTNVQKNIGYFISYENLFSTWLEMGSDFNVANVRDALSAFNRMINETYNKVFDKIFDTLQTGLSKLGDSSGSQTKAISDLIHLIKDIPMDGKQDYDVLGFIYEYLISNFAANAGKKAGEFYTPHEVSLLMSEIVADHLRGETEIKIYDPTSGSGSLLINIGKSVSKYIDDSKKIKFYAQELKANTYNLTRMNLVMRGIIPSNIITRNADTLKEDWPYFDESDPTGTYDPLYVNAVVSNPPYSQHWEPDDMENDPRYKRFGVAPKGKADYAFLLHDLYHIKPDGIMTIVLPHDKMEEEVVNLGKEIDRLEKQSAIDAELAKATSEPITNKPNGDVKGEKKTGRATEEYRKAFWDNMRSKSYFDVNNALSIGTDSEGGYLVPDEYERTLVEALGDEVFFRSLASVITTSSGDRKIPIVTAKGEAAWIDEGGQFPESDDSFGQTSISAYKLATMIKVSDELLNDSVFSVEGYISKEFGRRIGSKEEEAFFVGDGTGKPTGLFNKTGGAQTGVTAATADIKFDDVMDLYYSLRAPYRNKASWLLNDSTVKAIRKLKDGNGNYIWQPSVREGEPDRILNKPYKTSIFVPELAAGNRVLSFGDYSYYWIADRQGRSFKRLNELFATTGQVGFLASERVDGKLILAEAVKTLDIKAKTS